MQHMLIILVAEIIAGIIYHFISKPVNSYFEQRLDQIRAPSGKEVFLGRFVDFYFRFTKPLFFGILSFSILLNLLGAVVLGQSQCLMFLDTTGTALSAFVLGPWWAACVGLLSNSIGQLLIGPQTYNQFGLVNCMLGITWGYSALFLPNLISRVHPKKHRYSVLGVGLLGCFLSSIFACYILYWILNSQERTHTPNSFQVALYNSISVIHNHSSSARNYPEFFLFILTQLPFNIPDKLFTVAFALNIFDSAFPIAKPLAQLTSTFNFIKLSSGSHYAFCLLYCFYIFIFRQNSINIWILFSPLVVCGLSMFYLLHSIPSDMSDYNFLARFFGKPERQTVDTLFVTRGAFYLILTAAYFIVLYTLGLICHRWAGLPASLNPGEHLLKLLVALTYILLAYPLLFFLTTDVHSSAKAFEQEWAIHQEGKTMESKTEKPIRPIQLPLILS